MVATGQNNWSVKSENRKIKVTNYLREDERLDSIIVKTPISRFKLSYDHPIYSTEILDTITNTFVVTRVMKIDDDLYMLFGLGGDVGTGLFINLIFITKKKIIKHVIIESFDRLFTDLDYYYDKPKKELTFRRVIANRLYEIIPIHEVDFNDNKVNTIMPIEERDNYALKISELKKSRMMSGDYDDVVYYRIKL